MSATGEFRLSITRALGDQLADAISQLVPTPLTAANVSLLEARGGVYQLYKNGELVYIGKADKSLLERVGNHRRKISGRHGISLGEMSFTAIYVDEDLSAVAPETLLINRHRGAGQVTWNFNGFGNKDPGRERDTSAVRANNFDAMYPVDLEYQCSNVVVGGHTVSGLLSLLKADLPYVFRYQDGATRLDRQPAEYRDVNIRIEDEAPTADEAFRALSGALPDWQITALPGYVIMYKESRPYGSALRTYRAGGDI